MFGVGRRNLQCGGFIKKAISVTLAKRRERGAIYMLCVCGMDITRKIISVTLQTLHLNLSLSLPCSDRLCSFHFPNFGPALQAFSAGFFRKTVSLSKILFGYKFERCAGTGGGGGN